MTGEVPADWEQLHLSAQVATGRARATWSNLGVGAAGRAEPDSLLTSCPVERTSFERFPDAGCGRGSALPAAGAQLLLGVGILPLTLGGRRSQLLPADAGPEPPAGGREGSAPIPAGEPLAGAIGAGEPSRCPP